jgi:hypothetical protein
MTTYWQVKPIPVAARSKVWVRSRSIIRVAGSNAAGDMDSLLLVVYCQAEVSARADHSSRGTLPSVVCLSVIVKPGNK